MERKEGEIPVRMVYIMGTFGLKPCLTETFFELNLVTRVDMLRGEICCESGGVNGRDAYNN